MTPRQLTALWEAWKARERIAQRSSEIYLAKILGWLCISSGVKSQDGRALGPIDFMPEDCKPVQSQEELVEQQMLTMMQFRLYQEAMLEQKKG